MMYTSQGMLGLAEARLALQRVRSSVGQAHPGTQGHQQHSDQIKAIPVPAAHDSYPGYIITEARVVC